MCAEYGDMSSSQYKKGQKEIIDQAEEDTKVQLRQWTFLDDWNRHISFYFALFDLLVSPWKPLLCLLKESHCFVPFI